MKVYTHWEHNETEHQLEKKFFSRKDTQKQAASKARTKGHDVVAENTWQVEPTADSVAQFCNEQLSITCPEEDVNK